MKIVLWILMDCLYQFWRSLRLSKYIRTVIIRICCACKWIVPLSFLIHFLLLVKRDVWYSLKWEAISKLTQIISDISYCDI